MMFNCRMVNFCLIIIGDSDLRVENELNKVFIKKPLILHIPFIISGDQPEWLEWTMKDGKTLAGIGQGAAGCLIAHRRAWALLQSQGFKYAMVLESDAELTRYGRKYLEKFILKLGERDENIIHLGSHEKNLLVAKFENISRWSLRNILLEIYEKYLLKFSIPVLAARKFPFSTHAYVINSETASELLEIPPNFLAPVDVLLNAFSQVRSNKIATVRTPLLVQKLHSESLTRKFGR